MGIFIAIVILLGALLTYLLIEGHKKVAKHWRELEELEQRANTATEREEAIILLDDLIEFSEKTLSNPYIQQRVNRLYFYLRGLLKQKFIQDV